MDTSSSATEDSAQFARQLARWFARAGVAQTDLAVDLADLVSAAKEVEAGIRSLTALEVGRPGHDEEAAEIVGQLRATLFSEMKPHLKELERNWPSIEGPIFDRLPDEE